jgi:hypothetical protein
MINKAIFEDKWKLIRGQSTARWSLMADYDLVKVDKADVKFDKFVTMLQVKYGYTRQIARQEIATFWAEYEAKNRNTSETISQVIDNIRSKTNGHNTRKEKTKASLPRAA